MWLVGKDGRRYVVCSMWGKNKIQDSEEQVPGVRFQVPDAGGSTGIQDSGVGRAGVRCRVSGIRRLRLNWVEIFGEFQK
jgi:hypothetical protein